MNTVNKLLSRRFVLFTLVLLLKSSLAWLVVFGGGANLRMALTEIPFFCAVFCLIEIFARKRQLLYYVIANLIFTALYFTVLMYYKYYGIIVTYHAISQADKITKVKESTYSLLQPQYLLMFVDIVILLVLLVLYRSKGIRAPQLRLKPYRKAALRGILAVSIAVCMLNVWPNRASMNETEQAEEMGIMNYEVFTLLSDSTQKALLIDSKEITQTAIDKLKGIVPPQAPQYRGAEKGKNVIVIQMESFQSFLIGLKVNGVEVTPTMNRLAAGDFYYNHFYTMVGQGTTSDAEFTVNTSLYVPEHEPATQNDVNKVLPSLPKLMQQNGYTTATFHTNDVEFWNRKELYQALGWEKYFDHSYFGDEDHIAFGASDEVLYKKTAEQLIRMQDAGQPFYAQVISMSSHHPYNIPREKVTLDIPKKLNDTLAGRYLEAQNYADRALGGFIEQLKSSGLWDNSVVILYGDHQGLPVYALSKAEKSSLEEMLGHPYDYKDMFNIPLILHAPGITYPAVQPKTGGQIDLLPTIANLTGAPIDNQIHFGTDLLNAGSTPSLLPMRHFLPRGSVVSDTGIFVPGAGYEDGTPYPFAGSAADSGRVSLEEFNRTLSLLDYSDSYIAQLPDRTDAQ